MHFYTFINIKTKKEKDFYFSMKEAPKFGEVIEIEGEKYKRIITSAPAGFVHSGNDLFSSKDFVEKTGKQKGNVGNVLDEAKELSQKRAEKAGGVDPIQKNWFKNYSDKRQGRKHPLDK
jgi:hypothetical protein